MIRLADGILRLLFRPERVTRSDREASSVIVFQLRFPVTIDIVISC